LAATNQITSYDVGFAAGSANAEDVYSAIQNISITGTPFLSSAPQSTAKSTTHEWLTDALPALSYAGAIEGDAFSVATYGGFTNRVRLNNITQIFRRDYDVSGTQDEQNSPLGMDREFAYQSVLNGKAVYRNIEFALLHKTASGLVTSEGGARTCYNIMGMIGRGAGYASPSNAVSGGLALSNVNALGELMKQGGAEPDTIMLPLGVKADLTKSIMYNPGGAAASGGGIVYQQSPSTKYSGNITLVETDSGVYAVVANVLMNADLTTAQAAQASVSAVGFMYERSKLRVAWGRRLRARSLPPNGDSVRGFILGELTLEVLHPSSVGWFANVTT
jgi:hypothetical protein